jgi:hypothetical protein
MKSRQTEGWLPRARFLARLFLAPRDDRAAPLQWVFRLGTAEIWRLGQRRRSQYLAALLDRKCNETPVDAPDRFSGRTHSSVQPGASER